MTALTFDLSKDGLSLDTTNGELLLFTETSSVRLNMNVPSKLIINNDVSLCVKNQTLSLKGLSKFQFVPVNKVDSLAVNETAVNETALNKSRYAFRLHKYTYRVLQACSSKPLSRTEIFEKILDKKEFKEFSQLSKYERSYIYYRPLVWSLVTAGYLKPSLSSTRQNRLTNFQTTDAGIQFLNQ